MFASRTPALLAWSSLFALACGASSHAQYRLFGDKLEVQRIDEVRGARPEQRAAYLHTLGIGREDWFPPFDGRARELLASAQQGGLRDVDLYRDVFYGVELVGLLNEKSGAATLEGLVTTVGKVRTPEGELFAEGLVYVSLAALASLETSDEFLLSRIAGEDDRIARLAILATGLRRDDRMRDAHRTVRDRARKGPRVSEALEALSFLEHEAAGYEALTSVPDRMAYVEQRLRRANPLFSGVTALGDPQSAGHLVSRWAFEWWGELARANPQQVNAYIRSVDDYPTPKDAAAYQRFLARSAGPSIAREFEPEAR